MTKMKNYKNIITAASCVLLFGGALASCDGYLTVYPQDKITEETFWEDKNDLDGVRYATYKNMASLVDKMIIWGDLRSDAYLQNTVVSSSQGNRDKYRSMITADIDTTWSDYDWSGFYSTIGYCNKVLTHGQAVLDRDKQFTESEWRQMKAEMVTMRAMSYFYLVRAFRYIPYTTKIITTDSEVEYFPQLPAIDVMDSLITDVEQNAEGKARSRFTETTESKGMITNAAIDCLLSDMYLWRAALYQGIDSTAEAISDYQDCKKWAGMAIYRLGKQWDEEMQSAGPMTSKDGYLAWSNAPTFNGRELDFMYKNTIDDAQHGNVTMKAYNEIFDKQNSYESFFELQFNNTDSRTNSTVNSMWGYSESAHLVASGAVSANNSDYIDMRTFFSAWKEIDGVKSTQDYYMLKWMHATPTIEMSGSGGISTLKMAVESYDYNNWIVYRLSDALMQQAEADACLAELGVDAANNRLDCKRLCRMVNRRWFVDFKDGGEITTDLDADCSNAQMKSYEAKIENTTGTTNPKTDGYLSYVYKTRLLEFMGEGKRWFDIVRWAERDNHDYTRNPSDPGRDTDPGMEEMYAKFMNDAAITGWETTRNRCTNMWGLYNPIYYMEVKAYRANGSYIQQNPVWNKSKYDR